MTSAARYQSTRSACATGGAKRTTSAMPSCVRERLEVVRVREARCRSDLRRRRRRARRAAPGSARAGWAAARSRTSGALSGWIRPTKSSTWADAAMPEPTTGVLPVPWREDAEVDAGGDGGDPIRIGVVELDELRGLGAGVGQQPVGGGHDRGLTDDATGRLWHVAVGEQGVLHLRHRVHRVDQRHLPAVLGQRADLPREPVVRVHEVEVTGVVLRLDPQDAGRERAQQRGQVFLGHRLERTRGDVPHEDAGGELDRGGQARRRWRG